MQLVTREDVEDITRPPLLDRKKYFELAKERGLVSTDGEFFLMGANVLLNINVCGLTTYYFVSEDAAINYRELFYESARYPIVLCRRIKGI